MQTNTVMRWYFTHGRYPYGIDTPRAFTADCMDYHLRDGIAERVKCRPLVCEAEKDLFFQGQAQQLFDHLTCPQTMVKFTDAEGGGRIARWGGSARLCAHLRLAGRERSPLSI